MVAVVAGERGFSEITAKNEMSDIRSIVLSLIVYIRHVS